MRVIGVIDVQGAQAVHARGGNRADYAPVRSAAGHAVRGDPVALAHTYVHRLGVRELYVADLDAIEHGADALQAEVIGSIAALGVPVWLDAGVTTADAARRALATGIAKAVVGLETLSDFAALRAIRAATGRDAVAFSIDLRGGAPVAKASAALAATPVAALAARAAATDVGALVVLDLTRVGMGAGPDAATVGIVRDSAPNVPLFVGGGVRSAADLRRLTELGCDGALVASALIDGKICNLGVA